MERRQTLEAERIQRQAEEDARVRAEEQAAQQRRQAEKQAANKTAMRFAVALMQHWSRLRTSITRSTLASGGMRETRAYRKRAASSEQRNVRPPAKK